MIRPIKSTAMHKFAPISRLLQVIAAPPLRDLLRSHFRELAKQQ